MEEIIRVENLTHTYGEGTPFCRSAVQDMSLAIYRGEFLGIIGHTGSGKSTLIQHLNGLLKPTSGRILLGGEDIWSDPKKIRNVRFRVGLVFQYPEYQLFEETVYRDIAFGPTNMGLSKDEIDRRVRESAHFAGLTDDLLEKSPFALSGGQKRRVAIAGVIAMEPEVLVLDEPSAGLDPQGREELLSNIREFHRARGTTVVLVSHSMEEIARNLPITEGLERLMTILKRVGYKTAILSGGFTYFGNYLKQKYGFDYVYANELEVEEGRLTGRHVGEIVDGRRKAELLRLLCQVENINIAQSIAVGDGANDLPMLDLAGLGIAFHAKPKVKATASQSISTIGLDGVLYFLGLKDSWIE